MYVVTQDETAAITTLPECEVRDMIVSLDELKALELLVKAFMVDNEQKNAAIKKLTYYSPVSFYKFHPIPLFPLIPTTEHYPCSEQLERLHNFMSTPASKLRKKKDEASVISAAARYVLSERAHALVPGLRIGKLHAVHAPTLTLTRMRQGATQPIRAKKGRNHETEQPHSARPRDRCHCCSNAA